MLGMKEVARERVSEWRVNMVENREGKKNSRTQLFFIVLRCRHCWNGWCCIRSIAICLSARLHSVPVYGALCPVISNIDNYIHILTQAIGRAHVSALSSSRKIAHHTLFIICLCARTETPPLRQLHHRTTITAQSRAAFCCLFL